MTSTLPTAAQSRHEFVIPVCPGRQTAKSISFALNRVSAFGSLRRCELVLMGHLQHSLAIVAFTLGVCVNPTPGWTEMMVIALFSVIL